MENAVLQCSIITRDPFLVLAIQKMIEREDGIEQGQIHQNLDDWLAFRRDTSNPQCREEKQPREEKPGDAASSQRECLLLEIRDQAVLQKMLPLRPCFSGVELIIITDQRDVGFLLDLLRIGVYDCIIDGNVLQRVKTDLHQLLYEQDLRSRSKALTQSDLDDLRSARGSHHDEGTDSSEETLSPLISACILDCLQKHDAEWLCAAQIAVYTGYSAVTVRKYLQSRSMEQMLRVRKRETGGRPAKEYRVKPDQ